MQCQAPLFRCVGAISTEESCHVKKNYDISASPWRPRFTWSKHDHTQTTYIVQKWLAQLTVLIIAGGFMYQSWSPDPGIFVIIPSLLAYKLLSGCDSDKFRCKHSARYDLFAFQKRRQPHLRDFHLDQWPFSWIPEKTHCVYWYLFWL